jgi:hypothetical protein
VDDEEAARFLTDHPAPPCVSSVPMRLRARGLEPVLSIRGSWACLSGRLGGS